jgi:hypothetical protein
MGAAIEEEEEANLTTASCCAGMLDQFMIKGKGILLLSCESGNALASGGQGRRSYAPAFKSEDWSLAKHNVCVCVFRAGPNCIASTANRLRLLAANAAGSIFLRDHLACSCPSESVFLPACVLLAEGRGKGATDV